MEAVSMLEDRSAALPDEVVVARVIAGQKGLYEILLRRYNQTLYRAIRSYLREEADVEDAMQDTYLKAYEKLHQYKGDAAFSTWLVRIGINEALQRLRRTKKEHAYRAPAMGNERIMQLPDHTQMNPENRTIHRETDQLIERAIDRLPQVYRTVYMLREVEGMSHREIADLLSLTESNVKVRLHRAKTGLKETLWKQLADAPAFEFGTSRCDKLVASVMHRI